MQKCDLCRIKMKEKQTSAETQGSSAVHEAVRLGLRLCSRAFYLIGVTKALSPEMKAKIYIEKINSTS